ncbi:hypothetical protein L7F22_002758 [Adiantum nelumboides]|nr:hypothetical protein [Adiantum nelumboides]
MDEWRSEFEFWTTEEEERLEALKAIIEELYPGYTVVSIQEVSRCACVDQRVLNKARGNMMKLQEISRKEQGRGEWELAASAAGQAWTAKRSRLKPFIKVVNYNNIMPTKYTLDVDLKIVVVLEKLDAKAKRASRDKKGDEGFV